MREQTLSLLSRLSIKGATKGLVFASKDSPLCAKICEGIVCSKTMFLSARLQIIISPSMVHNIVKRFRESGEISVHKGQGQKLVLNVCNHRPTWAREYFALSDNDFSVCLCIKKCNLKLYYAKRTSIINFAQKRCQVLWA